MVQLSTLLGTPRTGADAASALPNLRHSQLRSERSLRTGEVLAHDLSAVLSRRATVAGLSVGAALAALPISRQAHAAAPSVIDSSNNQSPETIDHYVPRFGRARPVIAVLSDNSGTELTDFVIPFGVLSTANVADVVTVSTSDGTVAMHPALQIRASMTTAEFDGRFSQGADYVIVPALTRPDALSVLSWIRDQAAKGSTIVSICNGAIVVANTGLMNGHRATAHWSSEKMRAERHPSVRWEKNIRYVADEKIVSSAGISASIPVSIALVEAIAGRGRAAELAAKIGVTDWSSKHDSDAFQFRDGETMPAASDLLSFDSLGLSVADGVDEIELALTAEAYSHTRRARVYALAHTSAPIRAKAGLVIVPERVVGAKPGIDRILPPIGKGPSIQALDRALDAIVAEYGRSAAYTAARIMEYPGFAR